MIADDGRGMTPEELARAQGAISSEQETSEATGLGIRLSRQLIEAHGGTLEIDSKKGAGTVAVITLS